MKANRAEIKGLDRVRRNLNEKINEVQDQTVGGLLAGGLFLQGESQRLVPVATGNLKGSAFTRKKPDDAKAVEVGYNAAYAIYVHENLEAHHPNGQAKYLETPMRQKQDDIVRIIAEHSKVTK